MTYLQAATTYTIGSTYGILVEVNTGFTGSIALADNRGTFAVITNPTAVMPGKNYFGLQGPVTATVSGAGCDATISALNHQG
jgi:hypothetical protein